MVAKKLAAKGATYNVMMTAYVAIKLALVLWKIVEQNNASVAVVKQVNPKMIKYARTVGILLQ